MAVGVNSVSGATMIVNHGADADHFVLVVAGDGFTAAEQTAYTDAVDDFLVAMQAKAPYDDASVWRRFNVYRLETVSAESGANNPATCGDDAAIFGPGYVPAAPEEAITLYEAVYCTNDTRRLLTLEQESALLADLDTHVPAWDAVVVVVNHLEYGGSGNDVNGLAVYSLAPGATEIAIHELAHVLGLADEYDDLYDQFSGSDPDEPNVTTDLAAAKWSSLLTASSMPTWSSPDCTVTNETATDPEPDAIGLYEGGKRYRCGIYRPTHDCMMRHLGVPFCPVCDAHLRDYLAAVFHAGPTSECFVATAVYGDAAHPDVETMRRWRDRQLAPGAPARPAMALLAGAYARAGPPLARLTASRPPLARALRRFAFAPLAQALRRREP